MTRFTRNFWLAVRRRPDVVRSRVRAAYLASLAVTAVLPIAVSAETSASDIPVAVSIATRDVCRPTFLLDGRDSPAGTAFALHVPAFTDRDIIVSVHHLFGMASATTRGIPWADVPSRVRSAVCLSFDGKSTWRTAAAVAIPGIQAFWRLPDVNDVALLPIAKGPKPSPTLSPQPAKPGDIVYVLAQLEHPLPIDLVIHRARVVPSQGYLAFIYDEPRLRTSNISGAPVVSADGKVVGVNVGAGHLANGYVIGVADDLSTFETALSAVKALDLR